MDCRDHRHARSGRSRCLSRQRYRSAERRRTIGATSPAARLDYPQRALAALALVCDPTSLGHSGPPGQSLAAQGRNMMTTALHAMTYRTVESPFGPMTLAGSGSTLMRLVIAGQRREPDCSDWHHADEQAFPDVVAQLGAYFGGETTEFDVDLRLEGTDFQRRVWAAVQSIPVRPDSFLRSDRGTGRLTGASRAVGFAVGRQPPSRSSCPVIGWWAQPDASPAMSAVSTARKSCFALRLGYLASHPNAPKGWGVPLSTCQWEVVSARSIPLGRGSCRRPQPRRRRLPSSPAHR